MFSSTNYLRNAFFLIGGVFLIKLLYLLVYPVPLAGDEAYYWDWGRRPALGYYSKPAMIAWINTFASWVGDNSLFAIRFTSLLLATATQLVTLALALKMFDKRTAWFTTIVTSVLPGNCLLSLVLTIDAPLLFFWAVALYAFWELVNHRKVGLSLFLLFTSLVCGHLSKQMMTIFPILGTAYLIWDAQARPLLKKPGVWLALWGSMAGWLPLLYWNSKNEWITFNHIDSHFGVKAEESLQETLVERIGEFLVYLAGQIGALSPIFFGILILVTVLPLLKKQARAQLSKPTKLAIVFCGVPFVVISILAILQKVQPNWPAALYLAAAPAVGAWFATNHRPKLIRLAIFTAIAIGVAFYVSPVFFTLVNKEGDKLDPNRRFIKGQRYAEAIQSVRKEIPGWEDAFVIVAGHRYRPAWLGFGLPDHPRVYRTANHTESQYEVWPGPMADGLQGQDAIYITPGKPTTPPSSIKAAFAEIKSAKSVTYHVGETEETYTLFYCVGLKQAINSH